MANGELTQIKTLCLLEDDSDIRNLMVRYLEMEGYKVLSPDLSENLFEVFQNKAFQLLILDWMLPGRTGLEILHELRSHGHVEFSRMPVLMVTARAEDADIVRALEAGADDYITKPFSPSVLMARVQSLLRRARLHEEKHLHPTEKLEIGAFWLNKKTHRAYVGAQEISLTPSEFGMMVALMENAGCVLTRDQLISRLKGPGVNVVERTIDNYVLSLRKKLGHLGSLLETVRGIGYRVIHPAESSRSGTSPHVSV